MMRSLPPPQHCAICEESLDQTEIGRTLKLCFECTIDWQQSPEREKAARARAEFVERRRMELIGIQ